MTTMSISGSPMELLGAAPGISVIDPATVLTRQWYFDGKFLRAEGFRLDQDYVRALVALSNQAVGNGVAHGFDVRLGRGDTLAVGGGLALAPSGRVVYLPSDVDLAIAELITRSAGTFDPASAQPPGPADFSRCPPDEVDDAPLPVVARPLYVLTVAAADALCGEEERFGKLCADACSTETERSVAVDGVRFRVRELALTLTTSRTVPFTSRHLRSRVASAYYRAERGAVPSMISGAGLRTPIWCRGGEAVGGEEVPLAVFDRAGSVTSVVDQWTARRELVETSPQRSWQWRLAMRPLDVFLAQVLQFQCQLVDAATGGDPGTGPDPCAEERGALRQVDAALGALAASRSTPNLVRRDAPPVPAAVFERLGELRELVVSALAGGVASSSGSLLVDRGFVETPSGGYLPIDPAHDVTAQVRALFGPGVDLRFCSVRADFVPEALQEAQHMERISLTQGLDDPAALEEVDVLVPGGVVEERPGRLDAYLGRARILPGVLPGRGTEASAVALNAVARDRTESGWSWSLAAYGEAARQVGLVNLATTILRATKGPAPATRVTLTDEGAHDKSLAAPATTLRLNREGTDARVRLARITEAREAGRDAFVADAALTADAQRPVAGWFDVDTDRGLHLLNVGQRTTVRLRATLYSRATTSPLLADAMIDGVATLTSRQTIPGGSDELWVTRLDGIVDTLVITGDEVNDEPPSPLRNLELHWRVRAEGYDGVRLLSVVAATDDRSRPMGAFTADREFRHVTGLVGLTAAAAEGIETGGFEPVIDSAADGTRFRRLIDVSLDANAGALDAGSSGRDLAEAVISVIAAELTARDRENGFAALARQRMFGRAASPGSTITAAADWVMFHRRRTKDCEGAAPPAPVAVRRFRWYHVARTIGGDDDGAGGLASALTGRLRPVDSGGVRAFVRVTQPLDQLGIEPFTVVEFEEGATSLHSPAAALRAAWSSDARGDRLMVAAIATEGVGEGEAINRGRLRAATGAIADLIDISAARYLVVTTIPPELQSVGIDGVIVTQGASVAPVDTTCAHVLRLNVDQFERIVNTLPNLPDLGAVLELARSMDSPDPVVARFTGDDITNVDELQAWWPDQSSSRRAAFAVDRTIAGDSAKFATWAQSRVPKLLEVIAPADRIIAPDGVSIDLEGCEALVLIEEFFG